MSPVVVVVIAPVIDDDFRLGQRPESIDVQAFVAHPGVERLREPVVPGLTGWDETHTDPILSPVSQGLRCHLWAVVTPEHFRDTIDSDNTFQLGHEAGR